MTLLTLLWLHAPHFGKCRRLFANNLHLCIWHIILCKATYQYTCFLDSNTTSVATEKKRNNRKIVFTTQYIYTADFFYSSKYAIPNTPIDL